MGKIKNLLEIKRQIKKFKKEGKTIVLVTGVYDILHIGHVRFLGRAKASGEILIVMLDGDSVVRHKKSDRRPINQERIRAEVLESLMAVDLIYIFNPAHKPKFEDWFEICKILRPNILAVSENDPLLRQKRMSLKEIYCQVRVVTPLIKNESTTRIARLLEIE